MREKLEVAVAVLAIIICLVGLAALFCGCTPHKAFVLAIDQHTAVILPEYKGYVEGDPALDETSKRIRLESCGALRSLIETAKKEAGIHAPD